ncbi:hypothetical protein EAE96_003674 [Botrytis aclada]|nr:hypothetical protein EAE96_003674 [Botrytis aclada]
MKFNYLFLAAILAILSLEVEVDMNTVRTSQDGQRILTQGLDTCVAIIAVGTPSIIGGVAKVMAHMSTGSINVMQD